MAVELTSKLFVHPEMLPHLYSVWGFSLFWWVFFLVCWGFLFVYFVCLFWEGERDGVLGFFCILK